jgi:hypothetical protein
VNITHVRSGFPWAEKWPSIEMSLKRRKPDIGAGRRVTRERSGQQEAFGCEGGRNVFMAQIKMRHLLRDAPDDPA